MGGGQKQEGKVKASSWGRVRHCPGSSSAGRNPSRLHRAQSVHHTSRSSTTRQACREGQQQHPALTQRGRPQQAVQRGCRQAQRCRHLAPLLRRLQHQHGLGRGIDKGPGALEESSLRAGCVGSVRASQVGCHLLRRIATIDRRSLQNAPLSLAHPPASAVPQAALRHQKPPPLRRAPGRWLREQPGPRHSRAPSHQAKLQHAGIGGAGSVDRSECHAAEMQTAPDNHPCNRLPSSTHTTPAASVHTRQVHVAPVQVQQPLCIGCCFAGAAQLRQAQLSLQAKS